jgi:hypothetical protein
MNLIEQSLEAKLSERNTADMLKKRYEEKDWNGLLEAALLLNTLHHMERAKSAWAIREAASNLADNYGMDRDSA